VKIRPDIRPTTIREKKRGAGGYYFGFTGSMTWEELTHLIKKLFKTRKQK